MHGQELAELLSGRQLFQTLVGGRRYTYRLLTLQEAEAYAGLYKKQVLPYQEVCRRVFEYCKISDTVLPPHVPAGIPVSIGRFILTQSGDRESKLWVNDLHLARQTHGQMLSDLMKRVILMAFPGYTYERIEQWTYPTFVKRFTDAELMLQQRGAGYEPLDLGTLLEPPQTTDTDGSEGLTSEQLEQLERHTNEVDEMREKALQAIAKMG